MKTYIVSPHISPVLAYVVTKTKGNFDRFNLSFSGQKQIVFGELVNDHGTHLDVRVFNCPSGLVQIGRKYIVSVESGYHIYCEVTEHNNGHVADMYRDQHPDDNSRSPFRRVRYGAVHSKLIPSIKAIGNPINQGSHGFEFEKITQRVPSVVVIG